MQTKLKKNSKKVKKGKNWSRCSNIEATGSS